MGETLNGSPDSRGRLNDSTRYWVVIIITAILAVLGWSRNYGLSGEVTRNSVTIKENAATITNLRTDAARERAILERIEADVRDIKLMLQDR